MQRKRQELQANLLCLSAQVSSVSSSGLFILLSLWEDIVLHVFHLPSSCRCSFTGATGRRGLGLPLCGIMLQEWGGNWEFGPTDLVQADEMLKGGGGLLPEQHLSPPGLN